MKNKKLLGFSLMGVAAICLIMGTLFWSCGQQAACRQEGLFGAFPQNIVHALTIGGIGSHWEGSEGDKKLQVTSGAASRTITLPPPRSSH